MKNVSGSLWKPFSKGLFVQNPEEDLQGSKYVGILDGLATTMKFFAWFAFIFILVRPDLHVHHHNFICKNKHLFLVCFVHFLLIIYLVSLNSLCQWFVVSWMCGRKNSKIPLCRAHAAPPRLIATVITLPATSAHLAIWLDGLQAVLEVFVGLLTSGTHKERRKRSCEMIYQQQFQWISLSADAST